jgi:palmitoyltransferase
LIAWGAQLEKGELDYGMTPLHLAVISGNSKIVKKLLFCGVDKNSISFNNKKPYDLAL